MRVATKNFLSASLIIFIIIVCLVQPVFAFTPDKQLDYWDAKDSDYKVGYCSPANIQLFNLPGGLGYSTASSYLNTARNQWCCISTTETVSDPLNIAVFDGSREQLEARDPDLRYLNCLTDVRGTLAGYNYDGTRRIDVYHITYAAVYIPKQPFLYFWNSTNYKGAYVHELGHALGWLHCRFNTAVMYDHSKLNFYYLTWEDRRQLIQIYD
ncbi:MAG: matrixin family metalloprotease [Eubacteriales bacterium]|nr:matrixin family metalloprotease [Eubacteriales bacterium]